MGRKPKADTVPFPVFAFKRAETALLAVNAIARRAARRKADKEKAA